MAFQVSPGVQIKEIDLTLIVPAVSTTATGFAGYFETGPVGIRSAVPSINELRRIYGDPSNTNFEEFYTCANFLGYGANLQVVRVVNEDTSKNASVGSGSSEKILIKNKDDYDDKGADLGDNYFIAKFPAGSTNDVSKLYGNSLQVVAFNQTENSISLFDVSATFSNGILRSSQLDAPSAPDLTYLYASDESQIVNAPDDLRVLNGIREITGASAGCFRIDGSGVTANIGDATVNLESELISAYGIATGNVVEYRFEPADGSAIKFAYDTISNTTTTSFTFTTVPKTVLENLGVSLINTEDNETPLDGLGSGNLLDGKVSIRILGKLTVGSTQAGQENSNSGFLRSKFNDSFTTVLPASSFTATNNGTTGDLINIAVVDEDGFFTGVKGSVLETFDGVSVATNAKDEQGRSLYYRDIINDTSNFIYLGNRRLDEDFSKGVVGAIAFDQPIAPNSVFSTLRQNFYGSFTGGFAEGPTGGDVLTNGFELFEDSETVDISILLGGPHTGIQAKQIVDICDKRKDCVAFLSPPRDALLTSNGSPRTSDVQTANILAYRRGQNAVPNGGSENFTVDNLNVSSSYAVLDSGYKFMFDRFNDVFRYVPLSGDIAGLAVRSDFETETWFSPAGFNRGQLRDVVKLALNPKQIQRDQLYSNGINPVVSFPGQGTLLFGDKTMLAKPSAFDRINVRRLFIVLEKAIATAAKFQLFEFNDSFTRAQFKSLIEPFLLDVQSRRGIIDFKVVCDESNNTPEIIDRNEFVADIFIKPNRSINFITLNFIATRTGVNFDEIAGLAN